MPNKELAVLIDRGDHGNAGVEDIRRAPGQCIQSFTLVTLQDAGCLQDVHTLSVVVRQRGLLRRLCFLWIDNTLNTKDRLLN